MGDVEKEISGHQSACAWRDVFEHLRRLQLAAVCSQKGLVCAYLVTKGPCEEMFLNCHDFRTIAAQ